MQLHRFAFGLAGALMGLGFVSEARAQAWEASPAPAAPPGARFELGLRTGYGVAMGKVADGENSDLNDVIAGQIPLWLDLGARINHHIYVGGYVAYGFGINGSVLDDQCDDPTAPGVDVSCSTHDWRFGAQFQYHFGEPLQIDPWVGAGIGYELLGFGVTASQGGQEATVSFGASGWEFLNLQGGVDFPLSDAIALGPFAAFTVGQYDSTSSSCSGDCTGVTDEDEDINDKDLHHWLFLGVRSTFLF